MKRRRNAYGIIPIAIHLLFTYLWRCEVGHDEELGEVHLPPPHLTDALERNPGSLFHGVNIASDTSIS